NLSTTADVYTHTSADADRSAALALEQAIFGDLFQVVPRFGTWNKDATEKAMHAAQLATLTIRVTCRRERRRVLVAGGGFSVWGFPQPLPSARCSLFHNLRSIVVKLSPI